MYPHSTSFSENTKMTCHNYDEHQLRTASPPEIQKIFESWRSHLEKPVADALKNLRLAESDVHPQMTQTTTMTGCSTTTSSINGSNVNLKALFHTF